MHKITLDIIVDTDEQTQADTVARKTYQAVKDVLQKGPNASKVTVGVYKWIPKSPIIRPEQITVVQTLEPTLVGPKVQGTPEPHRGHA